MSLPCTTFLDAIKRVNQLVDFYAKELTRLEEGLTKLLLPAGLTFAAAILKDLINPQYFGAAVFFFCFFFVYALLIYYDLYVAERAFEAAFNLQNQLYDKQESDPSLPLGSVVSADVVAAYRAVDAGAGKQRYVLPTGKPLIAAVAGASGLLLCRLS